MSEAPGAARPARKHDIDAFAELVALHERRVYGLVYRFMGNEEDAKDLAQEALVRAFMSLERFRGECAFSTWLYRIAVNACIDEIRRRKREKTCSLADKGRPDDPEGAFSPKDRDFADSSPGPEDQVQAKELAGAVRKAIDMLPQDFRTVIILRDIEGLTYEEIASVLECSLGTVKSRLNRARNSLRKIITNTPDLASHLEKELLDGPGV